MSDVDRISDKISPSGPIVSFIDFMESRRAALVSIVGAEEWIL